MFFTFCFTQIKKHALSKCFPDCTAAVGDYGASLAYIQQRFEATNRTPADKRSIYRHVTCATDTAQVGLVWTSVTDVLLNNTMQEAGFKFA